MYFVTATQIASHSNIKIIANVIESYVRKFSLGDKQ